MNNVLTDSSGDVACGELRELFTGMHEIQGDNLTHPETYGIFSFAAVFLCEDSLLLTDHIIFKNSVSVDG